MPTGIIGIILLVAVAVLLSEDRRRINFRVVGSALLLQVMIAVVVLYIPAGQGFLGSLSNGVQGIVDHVRAGTGFLFGELGSGCLLYTSPSPRDVEESRMPSSA